MIIQIEQIKPAFQKNQGCNESVLCVGREVTYLLIITIKSRSLK